MGLSLAAGLHEIAMNFSAEKATRKWPYGAVGRGRAAMATAVAAWLVLCMPIDQAAAARRTIHWPWSGLLVERGPRPRHTVSRAAVPLPRPRPAEAPVAEAPNAASRAAEENQPAAERQAPGRDQKPAETTASPPAPSACRLALTDAIAIAPSIPDIHGPGGCGGDDLVRLEAVVLPDKRQVAVRPAAILRCAMASAIADWIRSDIAPLTAARGSVVSDLDNFDSFECRGRNRVANAKLSEHGRANALDVRALKLANGQSIALTDRTVPRELRESVLHSVCARFSTVLGPGSDGYHEDHIHLDLMERRNNYKICEWNVWDPLPQIAPLLPVARPDQAPPREVDAGKSDAAKPGAAEPDAGTPRK
jgi:hypothetical protein